MIDRRGEATRLSVRLAAFGTLSNGSDVRLLASPGDGSLTNEAKAEIERFFYKVWRGSRRRKGTYFAFLPLDHHDSGDVAHWGLMRASHLGEASMGAVVVVWVALIAAADLDRIEWQTQRLWSSALPEPRLPETGEKTELRPCELGPAWPAGLEPYLEDFESAAYALCDGPHRPSGGSVRLLLDVPTDDPSVALTPEGALFGVWNQLGRWSSDLSYCTWGGIDDEAPAEQGVGFRVLVGPGTSTRPRRDVRVGWTHEDEAPPEPTQAWLRIRDLETGISAASSYRKLKAEETEAFALSLVDWAKGSLQQGTFSPLDRLLDSATGPDNQGRSLDHGIIEAFPRVLANALAGVDASVRPALLEYYLTALLPRLEAHTSDPNPLYTAVRIGLDHHIVHQLSDPALEIVGQVLFDMPPGELDLLEPLLADVRAAPPDTVNWTGLLLVALSEPEADADRRDEALIDLVAGAWGRGEHAAAAQEGLAQYIDRRDPVAALDVVGAAPPAAKRSLFAAVASRRLKPRAGRSRFDPAPPRALVTALRLLATGTALEQDPRSRFR